MATADDPAALAEAPEEHELVAEATAGGDAATQVMTHDGIKLDLRIVPEENFGNLLQHFTGSAEHNVQLRERALAMGLSVSENGVAKVEGKKVHSFTDEAGVYELLELPYIEPELREGRGEIDAAASRRAARPGHRRRHPRRPALRTRRSPTAATRSRRWRRRPASAATPTSRSPTTPPATASATTSTRRRWRSGSRRSRKWNEKAPKGFRLLAGSEVNIGTEGELDYPDELLAELDWVVASVHTSFGISEKAMTERVVGGDRAPAGGLHRPPDRAGCCCGASPTRSTSSGSPRPRPPTAR